MAYPYELCEIISINLCIEKNDDLKRYSKSKLDFLKLFFIKIKTEKMVYSQSVYRV